MERFPRSKYLNRIAGVRRELWGWVATYRTITLPENRYSFSQQQRRVADDRQSWLEDIAQSLEEIEEKLAGVSN
jgi:hypothetical protein